MIRPWPTLSSDPVADCRVFRVRRDHKRSPRTGGLHDFFILECSSWVNVIALTPGGEIILIEQYRHGTESVELEIPGGVMDPGEASPLDTAVRELREETGYEGEEARIIGRILPNPAIQNNTAYTVLVQRCVQRHQVQFDHAEDLVTRLESLDALPPLVAAGRIRHSLVVVAFYHFDLWRRGLVASAAT
jgi:ADP-ribose pyrophosphatase